MPDSIPATLAALLNRYDGRLLRVRVEVERRDYKLAYEIDLRSKPGAIHGPAGDGGRQPPGWLGAVVDEYLSSP
jgi:hypothetical protein